MTRWYSEKKHEHYYKEAKKVGYRARSAFKLIQLQKKFNIIKKGDVVIDLGAAPGGWSQIATKTTGDTGLVISIDLLPIKPIENVRIIQGDVTKTETIEKIKQLLEDKKADVILSDMSPEISGNYSVDHARSLYLCEQALDTTNYLLKTNGTFICKLFEGEDTKEFINKVKQIFNAVKQYSPKASRKSSSETYIIGKSFKTDKKYRGANP